jgi:hypothetical protein
MQFSLLLLWAYHVSACWGAIEFCDFNYLWQHVHYGSGLLLTLKAVGRSCCHVLHPDVACTANQPRAE